MFAAALVPTVFGVLHHIDHVLRGATGWPLIAEPTPFTYSLAIYVVVLPGLWLTRTGRVAAGFWAAVALAGLAIVVPVHIGPVADDSLGAICAGYPDRPLACGGAIFVLSGLIAGLLVLLGTALHARRVAGHW